MKQTDGRKLTHEQLEYVRIQAVRAVVKGKRSPEEVIATFGLHRTNIYKWIKKYNEGGWEALKSSKSAGPKPKLSKSDELKLGKLLLKNPQQLRFEYALWTLEMIAELIESKFNTKLSTFSISRLLKKIGYTKQKPLYRAYQQNPESVQLWLNEQYPKIKKEAKNEQREIYFGDESGFQSTDHRGGTWGKKGETPIVKVTGQRYSTHSISALNNKGSLRFMVYDTKFTSPVFITFLKRLLVNQNNAITLIVDGHPVHKSTTVKQFIASTNGNLKLYILPSYSPELNPDELVWNNVKATLARNTIKSKGGLKKKVRASIHSLQKKESIVKAFFKHPDVAYAA